MRSASWRRRRNPGGRRPVFVRRWSRRRRRNSARRSCATSPRTSRWRRVPHRSMAASPMRRKVTKGGFMDILPMELVLSWPTDRRRCRTTCRASADACFTRRRRCSTWDLAAVCLVNSDSPTLPTAFLLQATHALLSPGERVVLGPAEDGGYYLLGMKRPHAHLFADIAWSTDSVAATTRCARCDAWSGCGHTADLVRRG